MEGRAAVVATIHGSSVSLSLVVARIFLAAPFRIPKFDEERGQTRPALPSPWCFSLRVDFSAPTVASVISSIVKEDGLSTRSRHGKHGMGIRVEHASALYSR